jgi:hypothetical protein
VGNQRCFLVYLFYTEGSSASDRQLIVAVLAP